jgi:hypothetical protein
MKKNYLITATVFSMNSGGTLVLYYLCKLLRDLGETAHLIPWQRRRNWCRTAKKNGFGDISLCWYEPTDEVVIYPDIVPKNPKNAKNVVRYLLHKPGHNTHGKINYGEDDLIVGWGKECSGSGYNITDENNIKIIYNMDDVYYQTNFGERTKTCYMIRKALRENRNKDICLHPNDAICLDGKSHEEVAKIFNECDKFICYDPYTHYSTFATKCGCTSIVIPDEGVSKEDWKPNVKDTYGIAYGLNDIEYVNETKDKFLEYQKEIEQNNIDAVRKFVKLCEEYFVD